MHANSARLEVESTQLEEDFMTTRKRGKAGGPPTVGVAVAGRRFLGDSLRRWR